MYIYHAHCIPRYARGVYMCPYHLALQIDFFSRRKFTLYFEHHIIEKLTNILFGMYKNTYSFTGTIFYYSFVLQAP
jgi:hypothetical protein